MFQYTALPGLQRADNQSADESDHNYSGTKYGRLDSIAKTASSKHVRPRVSGHEQQRDGQSHAGDYRESDVRHYKQRHYGNEAQNQITDELDERWNEIMPERTLFLTAIQLVKIVFAAVLNTGRIKSVHDNTDDCGCQ